MTSKINERGLPSIGGVSPGDTSNNLGKPNRLRHISGATGGHTQSADSGFSSKLSRVNRGRDDEKYAYRDMFPENEEDIEDDEVLYNYNIRLRSKLSSDLRGKKVMPERKLSLDIDTLIKDNEKFHLFLEDDRGGWISNILDDVGDFAFDVLGDTAANVAGFVPGFDLSRVVFNLNQLQNNIDEGKNLIDLYHSHNAIEVLEGAYYEDLDEITDSIVTNLSDTIEALISVIPVAGDTAGILKTLTNWAKRFGDILSSIPGGKMAKRGIVKSAIIRRLAGQLLGADWASLEGHFSNDVSLVKTVPASIAVAGTVADIMSNMDQFYEANNNYENLSVEEKSQIAIGLASAGRLKWIPKSIDSFDMKEYVQSGNLSENKVKIKNLIRKILNEEKKDHDCEKDHPGKTCKEYEDELEESSVSSSIGGYVGPMSSPSNPKKFYKGMLNAFPGSDYVGELPKSKA